MLIKGSYEDIIYIAIGILWIAYSIYKGTQKSKARNEKKSAIKQVKKENKKSVFETFLDDILVEEKPSTSIPYEDNLTITESELEKEALRNTEDISIKKNDQEKVFSYDDYYEEGNFQDEIDVIEKDDSKTVLKKKEIEKTTLSYRKKPRFDLRKAVIYSEILNRRYF